jgi:hypothetical protein
MNHKPTMLTVTAIVAPIAVTAISAMTTPALAGGHDHHGIKVNQSIDQANTCPPILPVWILDESHSTVCVNDGSNNADVQR